MSLLLRPLILVFCSVTSLSAQIPENWQALTTVAEVCRAYPDRMSKLLATLDLDRAGLADVRQAYEGGQLELAAAKLLDYYTEQAGVAYLRRPVPPRGEGSIPEADTIIRGIFTFYTQTDAVPELADGRLDWHHQGPAADIEWAWGLNRHPFLRTLLDAYSDSGQPAYALAIDRYLKDWVVSSLPYPAEKSRTAMWRGLEVSFRVKRWAEVFYGLIRSPHFSPAARLLLLSSIPEHAHYLRQFHAQGNWLTMEMSALARAATAWPEFRQAAEWLDYAREAMTASLLEQVYPDGVQTELTAHYHRVALSNFDEFRLIFEQAELPLPAVYTEKIEAMWNYLAYSLRPSGTNPLNNDSDLINYQEMLMKAAREFDRPDWLYIATNGSSGEAPRQSAHFFPYAGQAIFRSGFDEPAHWTFFDVGPWGSGHQHNDKLHLSIAAFGQDLLVDGGRFAYRGALAEKFRAYATGSASHNVLLVDGRGQAPGPKETTEPLPALHFSTNDQLDYAWGSVDQFEDLQGAAEHTRAVAYVRDKFWVVVDRLHSDRPRTADFLWHWHPECEVTVGRKGRIIAAHAAGKLAVIPIGKSRRWSVQLVKGQEDPEPQGWYSEAYNQAVPNTAGIYRTQTGDAAVFAWLLFPATDDLPRLRVRVSAQREDGLLLRIRAGQQKSELFVPFSDSTRISYREIP